MALAESIANQGVSQIHHTVNAQTLVNPLKMERGQARTRLSPCNHGHR
ncbi:hypothetical protein LPB19_00125 [Marinobacter salinisoli]|uniref:Uncharacterized protein n=1 Tax=Marinobacter salinisoli TaxID=2769486 RepID=A0ABX7MR95_9GAMM|nr:hypothetical protein [Marinobacter salinisoli]QSP94872.1 hypothetical protein LPB19_00125 [Marinobacter salinisoli]